LAKAGVYSYSYARSFCSALSWRELFSKAIVQAEWEANAPLREAMAIKRERLRVLRAKRGGPRGSSPRY
jgi:hypothetical protein